MATLAPQTGTAFRLRCGDRLKVTDPEGGQVADLFCFAQDNLIDTLSSGRSIDYNDTTSLSKGHSLYAHSGRIMMRILEDTCGRHDFLVTPCSQQMFRMISGDDTLSHPSCLENLQKPLATLGCDVSRISTTFNIFMNVPVASDGRITVLAPLSKAGDHILLEAEMDLFVGLTACSDPGSNGGRCKSVSFEIYEKR